VVEHRGRTRLVEEARFRAGVERELRQHKLQRDRAAESHVLGPVHDAHPAGA
jgi:hypothetical protein